MINFFVPINLTGYGICSYHLLKAYYKHCNKNIALLPISDYVQIQDDIINLLMKNRKRFNKHNPGVMICQDKYMPHFAGSPRIGFPIFEHDLFSPESLSGLESLDHIIVTSKWAKDILHKNGFNNVFVVNLGFDPKIFFPQISFDKKIKKSNDEVSFVTVGKFESRKNSLLTLALFLSTFSVFPKQVTLYAHMYNQMYDGWSSDIDSFLTQSGAVLENGFYVKGSIRIKIYDKIFPLFNELNTLYNKADFGVFLSCAEGWNMPLMECMAAGTPCLCTNVTAHTEFTEKLSDDFKIEAKQNVQDKTFQLPENPYLFSEAEIKEKLFDMANNVSVYYEKFYSYHEFLKNNFTWKHSAKQLENVLEIISNPKDKG